MSARLREVAEALLAHGGMIADSVTVEVGDDEPTLRLTVEVSGGLDLTELGIRLRQVSDLAQARALSERYGIPPEALERYIRKGE